MTRPSHAVSVSLDIPFHDCDPLFVAWHGRYFEYLEAGRQRLLATCSLDVPDLVKMGLRLFVTDARCRYMHPVTYGDRVTVTAWFADRLSSRPPGPDGAPLIKVAYDVFNDTRGRRSARAHTLLAVTDAEGSLLTELPAEVRARLPETT
jgi:acyl-CoA thioester hydrolase